MKKYPEIRWSEVARNAILDRIETVEKGKWIDAALKNSNLTPEQIARLSKKINRAAALYIVDECSKKV